ncbi:MULTISPECIES: TetR/AcrR family transcriptional regulator [unclassified Herbaspirillum]|uniref:TetR/AcrR family transcriptional regulator n=1 Tax=unclassified Herbaspirillum TaxID=2624150 RepID=UPI000E2EFBB5|nr:MULTISPECIES: TetR/AcrR family transcriptional regulator [unclassified Herbaspirillum]RFB68035.1 TetR/AcrR family transcriptional regulator [Herbaspirillum sp. 3R-3a1]TFI06478.1 TetR/AcrR family transcriptional regulator [Herbaspirillum sp. 3R11]TFI13910.1 TetR/AcrR family transcriptional regulator [Herbaspirillum sp. 3R-11]TFI19752.1 TetR/AcrR family transcriptional regulator [Herbaspirillum sp. 3C11]
MRKKSEERRQSIIDVAAEIFNEIGFDRASMAEISARLGGSKATLYNYFSSKEEIFLQVMKQQAGMQFESLFAILIQDDGTADMRDTLRLFANKYLHLVLSPEVIAVRRLLYYNAERSDLGCMYYENGPKRGWLVISEFMKRAMDRGDLREADPWLTAIQFRVLVEAEWAEGRILGVITSMPPAKIKESVERSLEAFFRIYGV